MDPQYLMQEHGARRVLQLGCTAAFFCAGAAGFGVGMMFWAGFSLGGIFSPNIAFFCLLQPIFAGWCSMQTLLGLFDQQEWVGCVLLVREEKEVPGLGGQGKAPHQKLGSITPDRLLLVWE